MLCSMEKKGRQRMRKIDSNCRISRIGNKKESSDEASPLIIEIVRRPFMSEGTCKYGNRIPVMGF